MTAFFTQIIRENSLEKVVYSEPYAGGAGTAINLLLTGEVERICINDAAIGIFSFWKYMIEEGERFLDTLDRVPLHLDEWQRQRRIFKQSTSPSFELGFATFYLSRTNRSGILSAGPIGGQDTEKQAKATYQLDCRFNKADLLTRIKNIISHRERIEVSNEDALFFLKGITDKSTVVYLDPPYYGMGQELYMNYYKHDDHVQLANYLRSATHFSWVLSYDNVPEILELYATFPLYQFDLCYSAQSIKKGSELLTHSNNIRFPDAISIKRKSGKIHILEIS